MARGGRASHLTLLVCAVVVALASGCTTPGEDGSPSPEQSPARAPTPSASPAYVTRADYLDRIAGMFQVDDPPAVEVVRVVEPEELQPLVTQCMAEAGFVADSSGTYTFPEDQTASLHLNFYICYAKYPIDDRYLQPMTTDQRLYVRTYWIESAIPCLADLGYVIPQPPTEETYLASLGTPDEYIVSGELHELGLSQSTIDAALAECPEMPRAADVYQH